MKIRTSYVSNSSSSSFILKSDSDVLKLRSSSCFSKEMVCKIGDLRKFSMDFASKYFLMSADEINNYCNSIRDNGSVPSFLLDMYFRYEFDVENIKKYLFDDGLKDDWYITDAIDRDDWAEYAYDMSFDVFDDDL